MFSLTSSLSAIVAEERELSDLLLVLQMSEAVQGCQRNACNRVIRDTANIVVSLAGVSN